MAYAKITSKFTRNIKAAKADIDTIVDIHLASVSRMLERGMSAPLDGLMMGIGPTGHKLFCACADVPKTHPDTVIGINFPNGVTVGTLAATLLGDGADEALKLIGLSRLNQAMGGDVVLIANRHIIEPLMKSLLDKIAATDRAVREHRLDSIRVH